MQRYLQKKKIQINKSCGFTCVATRRTPAYAVTLVTNLSDNLSILIKVCVITKQEISAGNNSVF